jgi:uncharacterized protein YjbI with pentapeptide repeats/broad specificity phosphatase PhoE
MSVNIIGVSALQSHTPLGVAAATPTDTARAGATSGCLGAIGVRRPQQVAIGGGGSLVPSPRIDTLMQRFTQQLGAAHARGTSAQLPGWQARPAGVGASPLHELLGPGKRVLLVPGQQAPTDSLFRMRPTTLNTINSFLATHPELIEGLNGPQREFWRSAVAVVIEASKLPTGSRDHITDRDIPAALQLAAQAARNFDPLNFRTAVSRTSTPEPPQRVDRSGNTDRASQTNADLDVNRVVPRLSTLRQQAMEELTPEYLQTMRDMDLEYVNTGTYTNVRHGKTDGNSTVGGRFDGSFGYQDLSLGAEDTRAQDVYGALLTAEAEGLASNLTDEIAVNAGEYDVIMHSTVPRAELTYQLATEGVQGLTPIVEPQRFMDEHNIGGLMSFHKPPKGARMRYPTELNTAGVPYGKDAFGRIAFQKNPPHMPPDFKPPNEPVLPSKERPVFTNKVSESWDGNAQRVRQGFQREVLPKLAEGQNVLAFNHQFTAAQILAELMGPKLNGRIAGASIDPVTEGHNIPNAAPTYYAVHVFQTKEGELISIPANAGLAQLAAPGAIPKGQERYLPPAAVRPTVPQRQYEGVRLADHVQPGRNGHGRLNLSNMDLRNVDRFRLQLAELQKADWKLDMDFRGADMRGLDLHGLNLRRAVMTGAQLQDANLSDAVLDGDHNVTVGPPGAKLDGANLEGASLRGARLFRVDLRGSNLNGVDMSGAYLKDADLRDAQLRHAMLDGIVGYRAKFNGADLRNSSFIDANLIEANLTDADLHGADLRNSRQRGVIWND